MDACKQWEGQVVDGRFELQQYLGGSQRSAVFLTRADGETSGKAAIKLLWIDPANAELQLYRWKQAAKLAHPNLLQIFHMGRCHVDNMALLYVVMEYASEDLSQILPERPLAPEEVCAMLDPTLDALAYLHGNGLVHGRLRPANILAIDDKVKLSSDAVCESAESTAGMAHPTVYDPPQSEGGRASPADDIWSLGVTLVEVLTQRTPVFDGRAEEVVLPETLPQEFVPIVRQCLLRDPLDRPAVRDIEEKLNIRPAAVKNDEQHTYTQPGEIINDCADSTTQMSAAARKRLVAKRSSAGSGRAWAAIVAIVALLGVWSLHRHHNTARLGASPAASAVMNAPAGVRASSGASGSLIEASAGVPGEQPGRKSAVSQPERRAVTTKQDSNAAPAMAVLQQPVPEASRTARNSIRGTLRVGVKIHVDAGGHVTSAELDSPARSRYFDNLALKTAREWTFQSAGAGHEPVPSTWLLRFEFRNSDAKVVPVEAFP